ncbi:TetR family transcriptional regulator [Streptomyces venezuelae]|uniref:TetR family transcriptional regulator n=1 Tax=Streptomyces venezuelae TaxID=54571 RepID=A0A5P2DSQ3_STRVZ|nr:TetR family transcriptional regulator C-terminal domain-containing protein [Streptomyces venezuelae]QES57580.1 TetR family transcriptional regulator [Streptomyces venezuelae]
MSSSVQRKRIRKSPEARRAEIVDTAAAVALAEGLECLTLRRIAEELAVRPGLISHYFPSVEDLVAEAFGTAAGAELEVLLPGAEGPPGADKDADKDGDGDGDGPTPAGRLARFFARTSGEDYDAISRLWINARHLSRYRPLLRDRVAEQEAAWRGRLHDLIREGAACGEFRTEDPYVTAIQILVVLDGLGAHANTEDRGRPEAVTRMAVTTAERELGLPRGALTVEA